MRKRNIQVSQSRPNAENSRKHGGKGLKERLLPCFQAQIFLVLFFEKIVEKADEKIGYSYGERNDCRAVDFLDEDTRRQDGG